MFLLILFLISSWNSSFLSFIDVPDIDVIVVCIQRIITEVHIKNKYCTRVHHLWY